MPAFLVVYLQSEAVGKSYYVAAAAAAAAVVVVVAIYFFALDISPTPFLYFRPDSNGAASLVRQ